MASLLYYFHLLFLFISFSLHQSQARENLFFSKAMHYDPSRETSSLTIPADLYYEGHKKFQPKHQFLPTETSKIYHDNKKDGVPYVSPRFSNNEFTTEVFENGNSVDHYGSGSTRHPTETTSYGYSGGMYKKQQGDVSDRGSSQRYRAYKGYDFMRENTEGHEAYNGGYRGFIGKSFEYKNGMVGYQTNHENQKNFVP